MRAYWRSNGPPLHIAAVAIASALGVKLIADTGPAAPSKSNKVVIDLDEFLAGAPADSIVMPIAGGDTLDASRALLEKLAELDNG
jgi:hypothetical protein